MKMFYVYSMVFFLAMLLVGLAVYYQVRKAIETNIDNELSNATATILNMVETTAKASIKNYLRAVAEKNLDIVIEYHAAVQSGKMTEAEAKKRIRKILFIQTIWENGYIYCVDSTGRVHPHLGAIC